MAQELEDEEKSAAVWRDLCAEAPSDRDLKSDRLTKAEWALVRGILALGAPAAPKNRIWQLEATALRGMFVDVHRCDASVRGDSTVNVLELVGVERETAVKIWRDLLIRRSMFYPAEVVMRTTSAIVRYEGKAHGTVVFRRNGPGGSWVVASWEGESTAAVDRTADAGMMLRQAWEDVCGGAASC